jgi:hypothetical protein
MDLDQPRRLFFSMAKSNEDHAVTPDEGVNARRSPAAPSADLRLVLKCADSGRMFAAPLAWGAVVVGRAGEGAAPTIDLTPILAGSHGVSRMHAAFCLSEGALYIEDLNSTNGTRINGFRIEPKRLYLLRNGDEVEFGRARLTVSLLRAPNPSSAR